MKPLHNFYFKKYRWYRAWHENALSGFVHWVSLFSLLAVLGGTLLITAYPKSFALNGSTWSAMTTGTNQLLYATSFAPGDTTTGWMVGAGGIIFSTTNSGATWVAQVSGVATDLRAVYAASTTTAYAAGVGGVILKTTNGGAAWVAQASGTVQNLEGFACVLGDANTCWTVGDNNTIVKTTNGGAAWVAQVGPVGIVSIAEIAVASANVAWAAADDGGGNGKLIATLNGGALWFDQGLTQAGNTFNGIALFDTNNGYAVGGGGIVRRMTDGTTWNVQASGTAVNLRAVTYGSTAQIAMTVGSGGVGISTTNGGTAWSAETTGTGNALFGLALVSDTIAYAVGATGTGLKMAPGSGSTSSVVAGLQLKPGLLNECSIVTLAASYASTSHLAYRVTTEKSSNRNESLFESFVNGTPLASTDASMSAGIPFSFGKSVLLDELLSWYAQLQSKANKTPAEEALMFALASEMRNLATVWQIIQSGGDVYPLATVSGKNFQDSMKRTYTYKLSNQNGSTTGPCSVQEYILKPPAKNAC